MTTSQMARVGGVGCFGGCRFDAALYLKINRFLRTCSVEITYHNSADKHAN